MAPCTPASRGEHSCPLRWLPRRPRLLLCGSHMRQLRRALGKAALLMLWCAALPTFPCRVRDWMEVEQVLGVLAAQVQA